MDEYSTLKKQYLMIKTIILFYRNSLKEIEKGKSLEEILKKPVREEIARMKYIPENNLEKFLEIHQKIESSF
jgi:V/A-type H+-transporting ATPase subunit A